MTQPSTAATAVNPAPGPFPRSTPSAQGVNAAGILAMLDALEAADLEMHSLMIARRGAVVAEGWWAPYAPDRVHLLYSVSKSFTATVVGLLVDEGRIDLDASAVEALGIDPSSHWIADGWRDVKVRHLISMTVGHAEEAWIGKVMEAHETPVQPGDDDPYARLIMSQPLPAEPGSVMCYTQDATYFLGRIVERVAGEPVTSIVARRVLPALGLTGPHARLLSDPTPHGHDKAFTGMHLTTECVLALAQLYLDDGCAQGERLLSSEWVREATTPLGVDRSQKAGGSDWTFGYGFSFWGCRHGYRGDGAYGQFAIVLPEHETVIAFTAETWRMQVMLNAVWDHLLPAIGESGDGDATAEAALAQRLSSLAITPLRSSEPPERAGWSRIRLVREPQSDIAPGYTSLVATREGEGWRLEIERPDADPVVLQAGDGQWVETVLDGTEATGRRVPLPVVASAGFSQSGAAASFTAHIRLIETPHRVEITGDPDVGRGLFSWSHIPLSSNDPLWMAANEVSPAG